MAELNLIDILSHIADYIDHNRHQTWDLIPKS